MKKIILIVIIIITCYFVYMGMSFYRTKYFRLININEEKFNILQNEFKLTFPQGTIIRNAAIRGDKDYCLLMKVSIVDDSLKMFIDSINRNFNYTKLIDIFTNDKLATWWNIENDKIDNIIEYNNIGIIYYKPDNGYIDIFLFKTDDFSSELFKIFK